MPTMPLSKSVEFRPDRIDVEKIRWSTVPSTRVQVHLTSHGAHTSGTISLINLGKEKIIL